MRDLSNIILNNRYQLQKKIGSGSYGIVYSARHLYTGKAYAVKIILKNQASGGNNKQLLQELENNLLYQALLNNGTLTTNLLSLDLIEKNGFKCKILKEISLQLRVHKHPNILSIYKVYDTKAALFVVMDYFPEGDLFATIVDKQRYKNDPFLVKSVFIQLVDAINYCHSKGIFHCDLKPENILVADNGTRLILADFGLALQDPFIESNICCGSSYYMSPERIQNFCQGFNSADAHSIHLERLLKPTTEGMHSNVKFPTSAGDIWSLTIILINLISIRNPWLKASLQDATFKAFVKDPTVLLKILPISKEIFNIMCRYLTLNPWERGSLFQFREEVLKCMRLSESGPLSINSGIDSLDIITTDSQRMIHPSRFDICPVPVDHVQLNRIRSRENSAIENIEQETNYIIDLPLLENGPDDGAQDHKSSKPKKCGSCVACGYGQPNPPQQQGLNSPCASSGSRSSSPSSKKQQSGGMFKRIFGKKHISPPPTAPPEHYQEHHEVLDFKTTSPTNLIALEQQQLQRQLQQQQQQQHQQQQTPPSPLNQQSLYQQQQEYQYNNNNQYNFNPYQQYQTQNKSTKIKIESLLTDYNSIFPSPTTSQKRNNVNNNSYSESNSVMSTTEREPTTGTSSNSSEQIEVLIHSEDEKINDLGEDLSMVSIMSVKNSTSCMTFDY